MALFKEKLGQPQPHDEGKQTGLQLWSHHELWSSPQTVRDELYLDILLFFLPSTGIVTWGCSWGVKLHSSIVKFGVKWSKNLQNTKKHHIQAW